MSVRLRARKSVRKIAAYGQSGRIVFHARASKKKAVRNPVFAQKIQDGMAQPDLMMIMSGRSETISITPHAVRVRVRLAVEPMFIINKILKSGFPLYNSYKVIQNN
jgi:hypothetical protein